MIIKISYFAILTIFIFFFDIFLMRLFRVSLSKDLIFNHEKSAED